MSSTRIYIKSATQISMQQPLSEEWLVNPVISNEPYVRSTDPDFKQWLTPLQSRRMGKILKRALTTSLKVMNDSGVEQPDAIMTGTGLGCVENTERFLYQLCQEGEDLLKPTNFMQSTHNTISSLIAIHRHLHGYNTTYSHKGISFETAMLDAITQMRLGDIRTALVTGNDEMSPTYYSILQRIGYVGQPGQVPASEASVAMLLTVDPVDSLCEIEDIQMGYIHPLGANNPAVPTTQVDKLVLGTNGIPAHDVLYEKIASQFQGVSRMDYKRLFGENYSASALGLYAAAHLLHQGYANRLLFVNHCDGQNIAFVTLKRTS